MIQAGILSVLIPASVDDVCSTVNGQSTSRHRTKGEVRNALPVTKVPKVRYGNDACAALRLFRWLAAR